MEHIRLAALRVVIVGGLRALAEGMWQNTVYGCRSSKSSDHPWSARGTIGLIRLHNWMLLHPLKSQMI
jgi:hypothetical protein